MHKGVKGDRYIVPRSVFEDGADGLGFRYAVVRSHGPHYVEMWFDGDNAPTVYRDRLEEWTSYYVSTDDYLPENEDTFQQVEIRAGIRKPAGVPRRRDPRANPTP